LQNVIEHPPRPVAQIDQTDSSGSDASACSASSLIRDGDSYVGDDGYMFREVDPELADWSLCSSERAAAAFKGACVNYGAVMYKKCEYSGHGSTSE